MHQGLSCSGHEGTKGSKGGHKGVECDRAIPASADGSGLVILASRLQRNTIVFPREPPKGPFRYICSSVVVETV